MKKITHLIIFILISSGIKAQNYGFGIIPNGGNAALVRAKANFNGNNVDISDIGFAFLVPTGNTTISNMSNFNGRVWTVNKITAVQLNSLSLGDGTRDLFVFNLAPGQTILSHSINSEIDLLSFEITNPPNSGTMEFLNNTDTLATGLGGVANSFFNANIDNTTTQDYFSGIIPSQSSLSFDTLSFLDESLTDTSLKIYPNPASDLIKIETNLSLEIIEIYDVNGKSVSRLNGETIVVINDLSNGTYFIKLFHETGFILKKFIKKN